MLTVITILYALGAVQMILLAKAVGTDSTTGVIMAAGWPLVMLLVVARMVARMVVRR